MQDIFVDDVGKGFPLVLVHGFLGSSKMWKPQIDYFKNKYRVISPDLPGFGRSNAIKPKNNINDMAEAIVSCLKDRNIENFFLLGHSMGGMVVQEMTKIVGKNIKKLICYGTGAVGNIPGRFETMQESRNRLKKDGLNFTSNRIAKTWFVKKDKSKYFYLCDEAGKSTTLKAADSALKAMENWNGLENLKNIKNPTLIIWGKKDKAYNFNQVDSLNKNIPSNEMVIFKDCSHNVHLENPDKFNMCVDKFLNKKKA
ncbi:alpha/beta hydrolase [Candidatus Pelagibacter sp.]|nr:alpha/beta hydrolase [Candidatus Pelagibacter sp.]